MGLREAGVHHHMKKVEVHDVIEVEVPDANLKMSDGRANIRFSSRTSNRAFFVFFFSFFVLLLIFSVIL